MSTFIKKFFDFRKNFLGVLSFYYIFSVFLISVFAYVIAPDNSFNANNMNLSIHSKKPGFKVTMIVQESVNKNSFKSFF